MSYSSPTKVPKLRRGVAVIAVVFISMALVALLVAGSDRMMGMRQLGSSDLAKQRAAAAAEAVGAMIESKLIDMAVDYAKLATPMENLAGTVDDPWWSLRGAVYTDSAGAVQGTGITTNLRPIWINGCVVRWRLEPVRIYNKAYSGTPTDASSSYVVNPPIDPSQATAWTTGAGSYAYGSDAPPGILNNAVQDFYHFRIVTQAYALTDPSNQTAQPWAAGTNGGLHTASVQSMRIIQIQSLQLFKYALFYAAPSPQGDLDLQTGGSIWIKKGAVHSNGAIYIRGGESNGFNQNNWHYMASGDDQNDNGTGQWINLGESASPITVTGVAGVFRMGKTGNCLAYNKNMKVTSAANTTVTLPLRSPMDIPLTAAKFVSDDFGTGTARMDLNGDNTTSTRHKINDIAFNRSNDSRSPAKMISDFKNRVRDSNNGGNFVRTLQNLPQLGGRPFEAQSIIFTVNGTPEQLYRDPSNPNYFSRYSTRLVGTTTTALEPVWYKINPTGSTLSGEIARSRNYRTVPDLVTVGAIGGAVPAAGRVVTAEEMPLWWRNDAFSQMDVMSPAEETALADQILEPSTFPAAVTVGAKTTTITKVLHAVSPSVSSIYTMDNLTNTSDQEKPLFYDTAGTLQTPSDGKGIPSFPGVSFNQSVTGYGMITWTPQFYGTGFSPREAKGYYLEQALFGDLAVAGTQSKQQQYYRSVIANGVAPDLNVTGLVIRERRWQQRPRTNGQQVRLSTVAENLGGTVANDFVATWNRYWPGDWLPGATKYYNQGVFADTGSAAIAGYDATDPVGNLTVAAIPRPTIANPASPTALEKLNYVNYLCSQYSVLFAGRNITAPFFCSILSKTNARDFLLTEDDFIDSRESGYMWGMYGAVGDTAGTYTGTPANAFYQYKFNAGGSIRLTKREDYTGITTNAFAATATLATTLAATDNTLTQDGLASSLTLPAHTSSTRFGVRWTGVITPGSTGTYTISATTDDRVRVTVNGGIVLTDDTEGAAATTSGTFAAIAGVPQSIVLEYRDSTNTGTPSVALTLTAPADDYRQNGLTINMRALQDWLKNTDMSTLGYPSSTQKAKDRFSGVIYTQRTRRGETYHPLFAPELDWPGRDTRVANNIESNPTRLVNQTHFHAYWFTDLVGSANTNGVPRSTRVTDNTATGDWYPPVNFPWNWREPSGPLETMRGCVRVRGRLDTEAASFGAVDWAHPASGTPPLGTSGTTIITPQRFYMWGDYAYDATAANVVPCAVFADNYTMLSVKWTDANNYNLPARGLTDGEQNGRGYSTTNAGSTNQYISMVINNSPNSKWNAGSFGSAGQEGTFRMLERWGGATITWSGSQVVMNEGRYHHSGHNYVGYNGTAVRAKAPAHMGVHAFTTGTNVYNFNTNLFSRAGRPPLSPSGIDATRVINQVTGYND